MNVNLDPKFPKARNLNTDFFFFFLFLGGAVENTDLTHIWPVAIRVQSKWVNKLEVGAYNLLSFLVTSTPEDSNWGSKTWNSKKVQCRFSVESASHET